MEDNNIKEEKQLLYNNKTEKNNLSENAKKILLTFYKNAKKDGMIIPQLMKEYASQMHFQTIKNHITLLLNRGFIQRIAKNMGPNRRLNVYDITKEGELECEKYLK